MAGTVPEFPRIGDTTWVDKAVAFAREWWLPIVVGIVALLVLSWIWKQVRWIIRRRKPIQINPKLEMYMSEGSGPLATLTPEGRRDAERIQATASGPQIVGYDVVRQVEAVFVDGYRRPEDAVLGLKATAARKGANAIVNVRTERGQQSRFSASGDAVIVHRLTGQDEKEEEA